jgi:hypothetical protein
MSADMLREAAKVMRERAQAATALPKGATHCTRSDHPSRRHGHYGYGGRSWCADFGSPLLSEENMGSRRVYAKPVGSPDAFRLAVADWLDAAAFDVVAGIPKTGTHMAALAVARAYLGTTP